MFIICTWILFLTIILIIYIKLYSHSDDRSDNYVHINKKCNIKSELADYNFCCKSTTRRNNCINNINYCVYCNMTRPCYNHPYC